MSSQTVPALLYLLAAILGAGGQYLYKLGARALTEVPVWRNLPLLGGILAFCAVMALFVTAYRLGGRIGTVYPFYATTFLWGTALGVWLDGERWSALQVGGVGVVLLGVVLVAMGSR